MEALSVVQHVLKNWNLDNIFICFNGGKDSTLLLHIFYSVLLELRFSCVERSRLTLLYLRNDPIDEVEHFLYQTVLFYNVKLIELDASEGLKPACAEFARRYPKKTLCLLGERLLLCNY